MEQLVTGFDEKVKKKPNVSIEPFESPSGLWKTSPCSYSLEPES